MNAETLREEVETLLRAGPLDRAKAMMNLSAEVQFLARDDSLAKSGAVFVSDYYQKFSPQHPEWRTFSIFVKQAHHLLRSQQLAMDSWLSGGDPDLLDAFPAMALVVIEKDNEPAGWEARWRAAGGRIIGGRAVALKEDVVWARFSSYGFPYPPFDWSGALYLEDLERDEAKALGLT